MIVRKYIYRSFFLHALIFIFFIFHQSTSSRLQSSIPTIAVSSSDSSNVYKDFYPVKKKVKKKKKISKSIKPKIIKKKDTQQAFTDNQIIEKTKKEEVIELVPEVVDFTNAETPSYTIDKSDIKTNNDNKQNVNITNNNIREYNKKSISVVDKRYFLMIREKIEREWFIPSSVLLDTLGMVIDIKVVINQDGTIKDIEILNKELMTKNDSFRSAAESAKRAILKSAPFNYPVNQFDNFETMIFNFDVKER